jgi:cytochrome c-type biogenesis protein CcmE
MQSVRRNKGSVILVAVFVVALLATLVMGILQINTEELLLMQNQVYSAEAQAVAEAGINDAFAELRDDDTWNSGFTGKAFAGGSYTVTVTGTVPELTVESVGTSARGFAAKIVTQVTISVNSPHIIRSNTRTKSG